MPFSHVYTVPPDFKPRDDNVPKMCCAVLGLVALLVMVSLLHNKNRQHNTFSHKMVPVMVSSMKAIFSEVKNNFTNHLTGISSKFSEVIDPADLLDAFSQTADDEVLTNLTPCQQGSLCTSQEVGNDEKKVNDDKVMNFMMNHDKMVMLVFAPWCGHCKTAMPKFCEARKKTKTPLAIVNSNMVSNSILNDELHVTHFPFIIRKTAQGTEVFKGAVNEDTIAEFSQISELQMMFQ